MKLREILADIHALEEELLAFERKYGLRSETFYPAYMNGEEPEGAAYRWPRLPVNSSLTTKFDWWSASGSYMIACR